MHEHDPIAFATGFSAKLATRSRHVCAFLGAGVGRACGLPDISQLQTKVLEKLTDDEQKAFRIQLNGRTLEEALSRLRRIAALVTADQTVDGLTDITAKALDVRVCQLIVRALDIKNASIEAVQHFAMWAARADYKLPLEIFTVNYDLLIETALESRGVPYFDGFVGNLAASFRTDLVEAPLRTDGESLPSFFVRLWKLHGSVNWAWQQDSRIVRLGQAVLDDSPAAIYPSDTKYEESRRVPFLVLQDRLRRALHTPETLLLISGYSFGDAHLNELIFDAVMRRERSEFIVFCYSDIPDAVAKRAICSPNLQVVSGTEAILSGIRSKWKTPENPPPNLWENGQFGLGDFTNLAYYLARGGSQEPDANMLLQKFISTAIAKPESSGAA